MSDAFELRGVVEGFYGPPWSTVARLDLVRFIADHGMNAYVYAPKEDPFHRARWREPYDVDMTAHFHDLGNTCRAREVRCGWAISPGLDIGYGSEQDRAALLRKIAPLVDLGFDWVVLALDDIPLTPGLAAEQAALITWLHGALHELHPGAQLTVCPTEYVGTRATSYLGSLAAGIPPDVDVLWTGPTVCSPTIATADADAWRAAVGGRRTIIWDNYPVNDGPMEQWLHLGAYRGRDPELAGVVAGVLCNPMSRPEASRVPLATAARFLGAPTGYDPEVAWSDAIREVAGPLAGPLATLARACEESPIRPAATLAIRPLVDATADALGGPDWIPPVRAAAGAFEQVLTDAARWRAEVGDIPLAEEIRPWWRQARREALAGLAALQLVQALRPVLARDGAIAAPDAEAAMQFAFGALFTWGAARAATGPAVFGARFGFHPAVVQLPDGRPALDVTLALREDGNAVDRLVRIALHDYARWCAAPSPPDPVQVTLDGVTLHDGPPGPGAPGNTSHGDTSNGDPSDDDHRATPLLRLPVDAACDVLLRSGMMTTRLVGPAYTLPFPDTRLGATA